MIKNIGDNVELEVRMEGADAVLVLKHAGAVGSVIVEGRVNAAILVDKITDIIPGEWDDKLLDDLALKLLAKKNVVIE